MEVKCRRRRRILAKLRGGTAGLQVETVRWRGVSREGRVRKNCQMEEVEDVEHLLMRCSSVADEREKLVRLRSNKAMWVRGWVWVGECGHRDGWEGVCDGKVWIKY